MLWVKRIITALVIWFFLFLVIGFGSFVVGAAVTGAKVASENTTADVETKRENVRKAGEEFGRSYGPMIFIGSFLGSGALAAAMSFTGLFPWCRRPRELP